MLVTRQLDAGATALCRYQINFPPRRAGDKGPHQGGPETGRDEVWGPLRSCQPLGSTSFGERRRGPDSPRAPSAAGRRRGLFVLAAPAPPGPPDPGGDESKPAGEARRSPRGAHLQSEPEHGAQDKVENDGGEGVERNAAGPGRAMLSRGSGVHGAEDRRPGHRGQRKRSGYRPYRGFPPCSSARGPIMQRRAGYPDAREVSFALTCKRRPMAPRAASILSSRDRCRRSSTRSTCGRCQPRRRASSALPTP